MNSGAKPLFAGPAGTNAATKHSVVESKFENLLYASRWLLAPIYFGRSLVDIAVVGGLIVMVMLSGYENFVSAIDINENDEKLDWLGKLDAGSLKQKVAASIVAISSIHLFKAFMNATQIDNDKLMW